MAEKPTGAVLVVGGGISGIQASLDLADSGYYVYLLEQKSAIGGIMAQLDKTFPTNDCSMCIISPKLVECGRHLNIELLTMTDIQSISGEAGNFTVNLFERPRYVDLSKCTACGECQKVCPIEMENGFDEGLSVRKAAYKLYPQGMPSAFTIEKIGTSPCKAACPAHVSIQGFIALMNQGQHKEALELFRKDHPFPALCGRICHHPCEDNCTRSDLDEPVAVQYLHRFLMDHDLVTENTVLPEPEENRKEKIAIVGSGPAGLSAAYFLRQQGYQITVFEKLPVVGGMMAVGIPEYRLPRDILQTEIGLIQDMGVDIKTGMTFGVDFTLESLQKDGFESVFLATGLHGDRRLGVEGEDLKGVLPGIQFLNDVSLGKEVAVAESVIVVGGGNVAIDVALTAKRLGGKNITLVCLETREEMPAWDYEIEEAEEENITIVNSLGPKRILEKNGKISGIEFKRCTSVFDADGRFNPQYDENETTTIEADTAIVAIGQTADLAFAEHQGIHITNRGGLDSNLQTFQTPIPWVFAGGDVVYGPKSVVEAIESGKQAAESMHRFIQQIDLTEGREKNWTFEKPDVENKPQYRRTPMKHTPVEEREGNFSEIAVGFTLEEALREADRCLKCGICSECYQCVQACLAGAIDHEMTAVERTIDVGSVILAPGFEPFDPTPYDSYSYSKFPNVVTSLEFERILSASGPYQGHLVRPSDNQEPKKIAWLQCVGSRDLNRCDNKYCSAVCCMYTVKQTVIAKEHSEDFLDTAVFYMDMRTFGKDFEKYYDRAREEKGVRFIRSRIHTIDPADNDNLNLKYVTEQGDLKEETFDMVVLSIGLAPRAEISGLAEKVGVELNHHNFAFTSDLNPVTTSKEGVFACGAFQSPKDIPQSVMEASASAAEATQALSDARGTLTKTKELPPELDISSQEPRVGVFVCNCGINIGGVADVPAVREYAANLPNVVHVEDNLFTCSQDTQDKMKEVIAEKEINRVVVASCSPRTHEPLFQETIRDVGLNKYLFEMANIRDQNTWVHMNEPEKATEKAKDLVRMAVAKAVYIEPLHQVAMDVKPSVLVVGGGIAGMESALGVAEQGFQAYFIEKTGTLGGYAHKIKHSWQGDAVGPYLEDLVARVKNHPLIQLSLYTEAIETTGTVGGFTTTLMSGTTTLTSKTIEHGASIIATGGEEYKPNGEYLYGEAENVKTHLEFDEALANGDLNLDDIDMTVFIQCVGSRNSERPYCSRVCCTHTLKSAVALKKEKPDMNVIVLYRDMRSYGFREELFQKARQLGVLFIRYHLDDPPVVTKNDDGGLTVKTKDHILQCPIELETDFVVLASAIVSSQNNDLFELFKIPVNNEGFLVEAHAKLRPVDFASEGIFMAGLAHYPKSIDETIAQAKAAVSRVMTIVSKDVIMVGGVVASVSDEACAACLTCVRTCSYDIPYIGEEGYAVITASDCHGCGSCVAECPGKAIHLQHFTDKQIIAKTEALFQKN